MYLLPRRREPGHHQVAPSGRCHHGRVLRDHDFHPDEPTVRIFRTPSPRVLRLDDSVAISEVVHGRVVLRHYAFAGHWFKINITTDLSGRLTETGDGARRVRGQLRHRHADGARDTGGPPDDLSVHGRAGPEPRRAHPRNPARRPGRGAYAATVEAEGWQGVELVDARSSDALNLAVLTGAPVLVALVMLEDSDRRQDGDSAEAVLMRRALAACPMTIKKAGP
jgi:hypothetical protein